MKVLVINAGSSSLKYQLIETDTESVLAKGVCERIGIDGSILKHKGKAEYEIQSAMPTHKEAIKLVLDALVDPEHGVISSMDEIAAVITAALATVLAGEESGKSYVVKSIKRVRNTGSAWRSAGLAENLSSF